jgi:lysophospholipase L1-like esterase
MFKGSLRAVKLIVCATGFLLALCVLRSTAQTAELESRPTLFQDGDRVVFAGDSITHGGMWHVYISDYYLTRFPGRHILFSNGGIAGDTAKGALQRFDRDILRDHPNRAVVMLGMNDMGLDYAQSPSPSQVKAQNWAVANYRTNMIKLLNDFAAKHISVIVVTPSPFDETTRIKAPNFPGKNEALARASDFLHVLAAKRHLPLVEFHKPMTALNLQLQKSDPMATLCGKDRVHPGDPGYLVMAALFLKAQDAPAEVDSVSIKLPNPGLVQADNCRVTNLDIQDDGLKFDYLPKSLPFPLSTNIQGTAALVDFNSTLNREMLRVEGLSGKQYELTINGMRIGTFDITNFSAGINLATLDTPMQLAAAKVVELNHKRAGLGFQLRNLEWFGIQLDHMGISRDDVAAIKSRREELINSPQAKPSMPFFQQQLDFYVQEKPKEAATRKAIAKLTAAIEDLLQVTNTFHFELRRVS